MSHFTLIADNSNDKTLHSEQIARQDKSANDEEITDGYRSGIEGYVERRSRSVSLPVDKGCIYKLWCNFRDRSIRVLRYVRGIVGCL